MGGGLHRHQDMRNFSPLVKSRGWRFIGRPVPRWFVLQTPNSWVGICSRVTGRCELWPLIVCIPVLSYFLTTD